MRDTYILCPECAHTANIHSESGCRAYRCGCLQGRPETGSKKPHK